MPYAMAIYRNEYSVYVEIRRADEVQVHGQIAAERTPE